MLVDILPQACKRSVVTFCRRDKINSFEDKIDNWVAKQNKWVACWGQRTFLGEYQKIKKQPECIKNQWARKGDD